MAPMQRGGLPAPGQMPWALRRPLRPVAQAWQPQAGVAGTFNAVEEIVLSNKISLYSVNTQSYYRSMSNTQISDRKWVVNALSFWKNAQPNKFANRKLINWNIEQLTKALNRLSNEPVASQEAAK
jgi:hypothetical protein